MLRERPLAQPKLIGGKKTRSKKWLGSTRIRQTTGKTPTTKPRLRFQVKKEVKGSERKMKVAATVNLSWKMGVRHKRAVVQQSQASAKLRVQVKSYQIYTESHETYKLYTKPSEHKGYVETLNLSVSRVPGEVFEGHQLLDFRENLWLHTTSILISMMVLRSQHQGVGIINPSYQEFALPDQRRRIAGGYGAAN
ncbi:hypothetical protein F444_13072 [Phytophthora nicotianae P1976]|uniref:Uncharacterized protein n=1 Tax=Phytophthora nicotianae P1976 TaxID=1317066 RepID=A0A080ZUX8_PHYNI|nr:hypothetical protein F444_13072 [Phytophthora nicotianae P1976]